MHRADDDHGHWNDVDGPILIAGDAADLHSIRDILGRLPMDAFGQVFIEVFGAIQIEHLQAPPRVNITWLCRDLRRSDERVGAGAAKGEPLVRAVEGWLDEWVHVDEATRQHFSLWIGCSTNVRVNRLCRTIERTTVTDERHTP